MLKVIQVPDDQLRLKSKPVLKVDKKIQVLVADMKKALLEQKDPEGVGLAAPQVGKNIRLFIVSYKNVNEVFINPEILEIKQMKPAYAKKATARQTKDEILEGCLSLPHYYGPIKRAQYLKLKYQDLSGRQIVKEFEGFYAQIIQHEIDHLEGILFIDRVIEQKSHLYKLSGKDWEEVELL
ncbi:MAG: peptide deformylase [Patescibacteria group bacterium]